MENARVEFSFDNGELSAKIYGDIDHHSAAAIRESIDHELYLRRPDFLIMELSAVDFMDSSGLGLVLGRYTKAKELNCTLKIAKPTSAVERILKLAGTGRIIEIIPEVK